MGIRHTLPELNGILIVRVGNPEEVLDVASVDEIEAVTMYTEEAPSGGPIDVRFWVDTAGEPSGVTVTIPDGAKTSGRVPVSLPVAPGDKLIRRVDVAASGGTSLSVLVEFSGVVPVDTSQGLTTLAEVKRYLNINPTDTTHDVDLQALIAGISQQFEQHCRQVLLARTVTEYLSGWCSPDLVLANLFHGQNDAAFTVYEGATQLTAGEQYTARSGLLLRLGAPLANGGLELTNWQQGDRNIRATYPAGLQDLGDDGLVRDAQALVAVCNDEVVRAFYRGNYAQAGGNRLGRTSRSIANVAESDSYGPEQWAPNTLHVLRAFRKLN